MIITMNTLQEARESLDEYLAIVSRKLNISVDPIYGTTDDVGCFVVAYRVTNQSVYCRYRPESILLSADNKFVFLDYSRTSATEKIEDYLKTEDFKDDFPLKIHSNDFIKKTSDNLSKFLAHPILDNTDVEISRDDEKIFNSLVGENGFRATMEDVLMLKAEVLFLMQSILFSKSIDNVLDCKFDTNTFYMTRELEAFLDS